MVSPETDIAPQNPKVHCIEDIENDKDSQLVKEERKSSDRTSYESPCTYSTFKTLPTEMIQVVIAHFENFRLLFKLTEVDKRILKYVKLMFNQRLGFLLDHNFDVLNVTNTSQLLTIIPRSTITSTGSMKIPIIDFYNKKYARLPKHISRFLPQFKEVKRVEIVYNKENKETNNKYEDWELTYDHDDIELVRKMYNVNKSLKSISTSISAMLS